MDRPPIRVPRWPAAAGEGPDFAAIRAEFDVPEEFPADALAEAERRAAAPSLPELDATDVPLVTLDPDDTTDHAVELMREHAVRRLPVVEHGGCPVGVVSLGDLAAEEDPHSALADISRATPTH